MNKTQKVASDPFAEILKRLVNDKGAAVFDAPVFKALLADYRAGDCVNEAALLLRVVEAGLIGRLSTAPASYEELLDAAIMFVDELEQSLFIAHDAASRMTDTLVFVLHDVELDTAAEIAQADNALAAEKAEADVVIAKEKAAIAKEKAEERRKQQNDHRYCNNCDKEVDEKYRYCPDCGKSPVWRMDKFIVPAGYEKVCNAYHMPAGTRYRRLSRYLVADDKTLYIRDPLGFSSLRGQMPVKCLVIPPSVKEIGEDAFCDDFIEELEINDGLIIGPRAFSINRIQKLVINGTPALIKEGAFDNALGDMRYDKPLASFTMPLCPVEAEAFSNCLIDELVIPEGVKHIETEVFVGSGIKSVVLPEGLETLKGLGGNEISEITIPESVTKFGEGALSGNKLEMIHIPSGVTSIDRGAFAGNKLKANIIPPEFDVIPGSVLQNNELTSLELYNKNVIIKEFAYHNNKIHSVVFHGFVKEIGLRAFDDNKITSVIFEQGVKRIEWGAFQNNEITTIVLPCGLEYLGVEAFKNNKLTFIEIPDGIEDIGASTFENNELSDIKLPDSIRTIRADAFANNRLTRITLPRNLEYIEHGVFRNNKLKEIIIPDRIKNLLYDVFAGNNIRRLTLGADVYIDYKNEVQTGWNGKVTRKYHSIFGLKKKQSEAFVKCYDENNKQAGTYIYKPTKNIWVLEK